MYPFMKTADLYATQTGVLKNIAWPKDTTQVLEYLFFVELGMDYHFPPRGTVLDGMGWIVTGSSLSQEEADKALEKALTEIVVDIQ